MQDVSFAVLDKKKDVIEKMGVSLVRKVKPFADMFSPIARNNNIEDNFFFYDAPTVIVIMAKNKTNGLLAAQNMKLVAEANGLGVVFSGYFTMVANMSCKIKKTIQVSKGKKVAMTLVLGYPNVKYLRSTPHKDLDVRYL